jgi:hypothetical protein
VDAEGLDAWRNGTNGFRNGYKSLNGTTCDRSAEGGGNLSLHAAAAEDNGQYGFVDCGISGLSVTDSRFDSNGQNGFYATNGDF